MTNTDIDTLNRLYNLDLRTKDDVVQYLDSVREPCDTVRTSEDVVLDKLGRDLYEKFFLGYTKKQWGMTPAQLNASVTSRIPVRTDHEDRYFTDRFQGIPADGYTRLFEQMLSHPNIEVRLGVDYFDVRDAVLADHTVYTGPVDAFYNYCYGRLPYRSLRFEHVYFAGKERHQPVGTVNYPNDHDYTRITEFKYLTGQSVKGTSIVCEYPCAEGDPYYPIPAESSEQLYRSYHALTEENQDVTFVGRLAQYRYYNMDQVVGASLAAVSRILSNG